MVFRHLTRHSSRRANARGSIQVLGRMSKQRIRILVLAVLVLSLATACALGLHSIFVPPYTDEQIRASLVDTWEVEAISTTVSLLLFLPAAVSAMGLAYRGNKLSRILSGTAVLLAIAGSVLFTSSHGFLTARTTQITGQTFAGFYGLF
jgi:hypothetical protein